MTTIKSTSGKKAVNISDNNGTVNAMYIQFSDRDEQVLESKTFKSVKSAEKWAKRILN